MISYILFRDTLKTGLGDIFEDSLEEAISTQKLKENVLTAIPKDVMPYTNGWGNYNLVLNRNSFVQINSREFTLENISGDWNEYRGIYFKPEFIPNFEIEKGQKVRISFYAKGKGTLNTGLENVKRVNHLINSEEYKYFEYTFTMGKSFTDLKEQTDYRALVFYITRGTEVSIKNPELRLYSL